MLRRLLVLVTLVPWTAIAQQQATMRAGETITVERILVDARVTDARGEPVTGLTPADFRVRIDGKPATIASADWIPETEGARQLAEIDREEAHETLQTPPPEGRLLIFFFQTDFAREVVRVGGQMKILSYADRLIDSLEPLDRVAVLSFDSHLKFRLDFESDKERVAAAMRDALAIDEPPRPPLVPSPSLSRHLDAAALKACATPEQALLLLGNALRPIPGSKSLVLFGWGLGHYAGGRVHMGMDYAVAQRALEQSRTSVFSIDITQADGHSLAAGLNKAAEDTGGFYAETYLFPQFALDRLQRTLQGHYELEVIKPETTIVGVHAIEVDVAGHRGAVVLARKTYLDKS